MSILDGLIVLLVILWFGGFSLKIAGGFIHLLLVIAAIILIARLLGWKS
jgi:hypothetical protein